MRQRNHTRQRGAAAVLAVLILVIGASLAAVMATQTDLHMRKAQNLAQVQEARLQGESGLAYLSYMLRQAGVAGRLSGQQAMDDLAASLGSRLNGTATLGGHSISYTGTTVTVPFAPVEPTGSRFTGTITLVDAQSIRVDVAGQINHSSRAVAMQFQLVPKNSVALNFGIASRGKITLTGNASVRGANDAIEGSVLSATYSASEAVNMNGNCTLSGDVSISNPAGYATLSGNVSIGGESSGSGLIQEHIHIGVGDVDFPEADPSVFAPFATNIVDSHTSTNGNKTFTNIRIKAGTNPTFSGNITLNGIVFVESPNRVTFAGNLTCTGVVITQDAGGGDLANNCVKFTGNSSFRGVDQLPNQPEFAGLKAMPGTFLLAPGFSVTFNGNFGTIGGAMGANEFKWTGNAGGTVRGAVINWGDTPFSMVGNSCVTIDRSHDPSAYPGFGSRQTLQPRPDTYEEH